jgi:hypothetical protein
VLTLGFAGPPGPAWHALYRVDVLGVALGVGTVAVLAGGPGGTTRQRVIVAAVLATLATGAFFQSVVTANANPFDWGSLQLNLVILAMLQTAQVVAAILLLVRRGRGQRGSVHRLLVYYWLAALVPLLGLGKVASWHNYWIEWSVPTALLAVAGIQAAMSYPRRGVGSRAAFAVAACALAGSVAMATVVAAWSSGSAIDASRDRVEREAAIADVIACVKAAPGEAIAMPMDVVVLAGKRLFIDAAIHKFLADDGQLSTAPLLQTIRSGGVGVVVMDLRSDTDQWIHGAGQPIWREDVLQALRDSMTLRSEKAGRLIYTPKGNQPPPECR